MQCVIFFYPPLESHKLLVSTFSTIPHLIAHQDDYNFCLDVNVPKRRRTWNLVSWKFRGVEFDKICYASLRIGSGGRVFIIWSYVNVSSEGKNLFVRGSELCPSQNNYAPNNRCALFSSVFKPWKCQRKCLDSWHLRKVYTVTILGSLSSHSTPCNLCS
jgi:hypothetical protein